MVEDSKEISRPVVGLMGGICSGKSIAARCFENEGFLRIDADVLAHSLLESAEIQKKLKKCFGNGIFDSNGVVEKKRLAGMVFENRKNLEKLNSVIHPPVIEKIKNRLCYTEAPVVLDAALLVETNLDERFCTFLLFVERPLKGRINTAVCERGWEEGELQQREAMQIPLDVKKKKADKVIANSGSLSRFEKKVSKIAKDLLIK